MFSLFYVDLRPYVGELTRKQKQPIPNNSHNGSAPKVNNDVENLWRHIQKTIYKWFSTSNCWFILGYIIYLMVYVNIYIYIYIYIYICNSLGKWFIFHVGSSIRLPLVTHYNEDERPVLPILAWTESLLETTIFNEQNEDTQSTLFKHLWLTMSDIRSCTFHHLINYILS